MRGDDTRTGELFSYVDLEARVRRDHPLRAIRTIVNEALGAQERELDALLSPLGRPSIPPEKLVRAMLLQAFYSIRSERLLMERLEYDLLFRWFVGIDVDDGMGSLDVLQEPRSAAGRSISVLSQTAQELAMIYCLSVLKMSGLLWRAIASSKAATQKYASNVFAMRQASTLRVNQSMIATRYKEPHRIGR